MPPRHLAGCAVVCVLLYTPAAGGQALGQRGPCTYMHEGFPTLSGIACIDYAGTNDQALQIEGVGRVPTPGILKRTTHGARVTYSVDILYKPETPFDRNLNLLIAVRYDGQRLRYINHQLSQGQAASSVYSESDAVGSAVFVVDTAHLAPRSRFRVDITFAVTGTGSKVPTNELTSGTIAFGYQQKADVFGVVEAFPRDAKLEWYKAATSQSTVGSFVDLKLKELVGLIFEQMSGLGTVANYVQVFHQAQAVGLPPLFIVSTAAAQCRDVTEWTVTLDDNQQLSRTFTTPPALLTMFESVTPEKLAEFPGWLFQATGSGAGASIPEAPPTVPRADWQKYARDVAIWKGSIPLRRAKRLEWKDRCGNLLGVFPKATADEPFASNRGSNTVPVTNARRSGNFRVAPSNLHFSATAGDFAIRQSVELSNRGTTARSINVSVSGDGFFLERPATPSGKLRVMTPEAAVRFEPRVDSQVMATFEIGTVVDVVNRQGDWYSVIFPSGIEGLQRSGYLEASEVELSASGSPSSSASSTTVPLGPNESEIIWIGLAPRLKNSTGEITFDDGHTKRTVKLASRVQSPRIKVSTPTVAFSAKLGAADRQSITIQNDGDGALRISTLQVNQPFVLENEISGAVIRPRGRETVWLRYQPTSDQVSESNLVIKHNDAAAGKETAIALRATVPQTATLRVEVFNTEGGSPLAATKITATNVETGRKFNGGTGTASGYSFDDLPVGTYKVEAKRAGFVDGSLSVRLANREDLERSIGLSPKPKSNRGELFGSILLGVLEGIAAAQGQPPIVQQPVAPPVEQNGSPGFAGRCGNTVEMTMVLENGTRFPGRFVLGPALANFFKTQPLGQIIAFLNTLPTRGRMGVYPPGPPGVPQSEFDAYLNQVENWFVSTDRLIPIGVEVDRLEVRDICGNLSIFPRR